MKFKKQAFEINVENGLLQREDMDEWLESGKVRDASRAKYKENAAMKTKKEGAAKADEDGAWNPKMRFDKI